MKRWMAVLILCFLFCVTICADCANAAEVTIAWDASPSVGVTGYKMYYGPASRSYNKTIDVGNVLEHTVTNLQVGVTYYFAITAYNQDGESGYSNEPVKRFPLPAPEPPPNVRIIVVEVGENGSINLRLAEPAEVIAAAGIRGGIE